MNKIECFRLYFEPDEVEPRFLRLKWEKRPVGIAEILREGIHPWMGKDQHPSLTLALLERLNNPCWKPAELDPHGYCQSFHSGYSAGCSGTAASQFERTLEQIGKELYFTEELSYLQLIGMAKMRLRERWSHALAKRMASNLYHGFPALRSFLKRKDASLRLSGFADLDGCDLGRALSLDDFEGQDGLIVTTAFEVPMFRKAAALKEITDDRGRLRLVPRISKLTVQNASVALDGVCMSWHVTVEGETLRFRPDIGDSTSKRACARCFAKIWRTDEGTLCFTTPMERLVDMVESGAVVPSFPRLNYLNTSSTSVAYGTPRAKPVEAFRVGGYPNAKWSGERLKSLLRVLGASRSGSKKLLLKRIAVLAEAEYGAVRAQLDAYFLDHKYVRVRKPVRRAKPLPVCDTMGELGNLVVIMYVLMHLRGDTILDGNHVNVSCTEGDLAQGLLHGDVAVSGAFVRAV